MPTELKKFTKQKLCNKRQIVCKAVTVLQTVHKRKNIQSNAVIGEA